MPGAGSQLGWLLWAGALEPEAAAAAAERLAAPDVLTAFGLRTLVVRRIPRSAPARYHRGGDLAVRLLARLGRAARGRARGRRPSACGRGVLAALDRLGLRAGALRGDARPGQLEPVPVANRVQAWTVGARWALEQGWDGGVPGPHRWRAAIALGRPR